MHSSNAKPSRRWFHDALWRRRSRQCPFSKGDQSLVKKVQLITDGACIGNPGRGGWSAILRYGDKKREIFGHAPHTTNNRMELTAAIEGLRAIQESCVVEVITDSE
jgi:hypothetical protein